jgi:hypothetical protein
MNDTIYWDNLEARHAPLVCSPNGGDPEYAFVCMYTLRFLSTLSILNGVWLMASVYRKMKLDNMSGKRVAVDRGTRSTQMATTTRKKATGGTFVQKKAFGKRGLSNLARNALYAGLVSLSGGLLLALNGHGTSFVVDTARGKAGDACCECGVRSRNTLLH